MAEKPTAAKRIAKVLDDKSVKINIAVIRIQGKVKTKLPDTVGYFLENNGKRLIILSAFGHLFTLVQDGIGWQYPVYDFKWVPLHHTIQKLDQSNFHLRIESAIESMRFVAKKAKEHIIMTDYDEEGEVIGGVTLSKLMGENCLNTVKRMKFSTFAKKEVLDSFSNLFKKKDVGINMGMYNRGLMRHYLDWLWGINLSRALMLSLKNTSGKYHTLSTGRVQGPTLSFVAEREIERNTFVPIPYFNFEVSVKNNFGKFDLIYNLGNISERSKANKIRKEIKENGNAKVISVNKRKSKNHPPPPYNLSSLQKDAYLYYKLNPSRTLQIAEKLYLAAAISYPRTSSEQFPKDLNHVNILKKLGRQKAFTVAKDIIKSDRIKKPKEGKKTDPAHPCIYPTGLKPSNANLTDLKIYSLIIHRYFACFGAPAIIESNRVDFDLATNLFHINGSRTIDMGWKLWAGVLGQTRDKELPPFRKGATLKIIKAVVKNKFTKPSPAFNQASLLRMMETKEIGTKATRSEIINSIFERKYLSGDPIKLTPVGEIVIDVLKNYSPQVISVELSRQLEIMGDLIEGKSNFHLHDAITQGIISLHEMLKDLKENETEIGYLIDNQLTHLRKEEVIIGACMDCGSGNLKIIKSLSSGKRFVGCSNYFKDNSCNATYPLPQKGKLEPINTCKSDNYPQLRVYGGKKPWNLCLNPDCVIRAEFKQKIKLAAERKAIRSNQKKVNKNRRASKKNKIVLVNKKLNKKKGDVKK